MASGLEVIQNRKIRYFFRSLIPVPDFNLSERVAVWWQANIYSSVVWPIDMIGKSVRLIPDLGMYVEHVQSVNSSVVPFSKEHIRTFVIVINIASHL